MKRHALAPMLVMVIGMSLATSVACHATTPESPTWQLTPYTGYGFFIDPVPTHTPSGLRVKDNLHIGGALGWQPFQRFGAEVGMGWTPTEAKLGGQDARFVHGHGDVLLSPLRGSGWDLYTLLGGGLEHYTSTGTPRTTGSIETGAGGA